MVAIRRDLQRAKGSIFTLKNGLILLIVGQLVNMMYKGSKVSTQSSSLMDILQHDEPQHRQPLPDDHTDHDDYVEAPGSEKKKVHPEDLHPKKHVSEDDEDAHAKILQQQQKGDNESDDDDDDDDDDEEDEKDKKKEKDTKKEVKPVQKPVSKELDDKTKAVLQKHGTGITQYGFVVDMVHQREHPAFRSGPIVDPEEDMEKIVAIADGKTVKSCEYINKRRISQRTVCRDPETTLYAYNSASFTRTLCGQEVPPGEAVELEKHCDEPVRLLPQDKPPISGKDMPPIVVQSQPSKPKGDLIDIPCDVPCKYEEGLKSLERYVAGTPWKIIFSDEDPATSSHGKIEQTAYRNDIYYSIHSMKASIPLSTYDFKKYSLRDRPAIDWESSGNKVTYLQDTDCNGGPLRRHKWAAAVKSGFDLAAYGKCEHNVDLGDDDASDTLAGRIDLAKKNRLHLALEYAGTKDYVSSTVWESLLSGAVPAILGAPNLANILPKNSFINANIYNNWDVFTTYLKEVSENQSAWNSFQTWRTDEAEISAFEDRFEFVKTSPQCRTCRWAYAKKYGLGWNHIKQKIEEPPLGREFCVDEDKKLITSPFQETWVAKESETATFGKGTCTSSTSEYTFDFDGYKIERTATYHDGVTDIVIRGPSDGKAPEDIILRFRFGVKNAEGAFFRDTHTLVATERGPLVSSASIQDENTKVTVLANWETKISSNDEGTLEVIIAKADGTEQQDTVKKLRIITEGISIEYDKLTEYYPSSYSKIMIKDFVDPIELFYTDNN